MDLDNYLEKDSFNMFEFEDDDGNDCFAMIDMDLAKVTNKVAFPYLVWIEAHYLEKDKNGFPTKEDAEAIDQLEKLILKKFSKTCSFKFAGHTAIPNFREIIIYVDAADKAQVAINRLKHDVGDRQVTFDIEEDPTWEGIAGFLED